MKSLVLLLFVFSMASFCALSQYDPVFTSDGFSPFWNNPAATGSLNKFSANIIYRNQWPSIPGNFNTLGFAIESDIKFGLKSSGKQLNLPIGLNAIFQQVGARRVQTINVPLSIPLKLKNSTLAFGLSAGIKYIKYDWNGFLIGGPSFYEGGRSLDLNAGVFWSGKKHYLGISVTNITSPKFDNYVINPNINFQAGYKFKIGKHYIYPMLNGASGGGFHYVTAMTYFQFKEDVFSLGAGFTPRQSYALAATVSVKQFKLAYVFDNTISTLSNASGGSHEFKLSYAIAK